jgi:hypothetical protein
LEACRFLAASPLYCYRPHVPILKGFNTSSVIAKVGIGAVPND